MTVKESGASHHEDDVGLECIVVKIRTVCPHCLIVKTKIASAEGFGFKNRVASLGCQD